MCALNLILGGAFKIYLCTYSTCLYKIFFALYLPLDSGVKSDMLKNVMILSNLVEILLQLSSSREWFGPVVVVGPGETVGTRIYITSNSRILTTSIAMQAHLTTFLLPICLYLVPIPDSSNTRSLFQDSVVLETNIIEFLGDGQTRHPCSYNHYFQTLIFNLLLSSESCCSQEM